MGGGAGFMSSRGTANLLTRTTAILAVCFFLTSLFMSWWAAHDRRPTSVFTQPAGQTGAPSAPVSSGGSGGLLDTLRQSDQQQNQSPAPPRSQ
jgi:preprotein translocase subunit SecG